MADTRRTLTSTVLTLALMAIGDTTLAWAQVPTAAEPLTPRPFVIRRPPGDLDALTQLYNISDWAALQRLGRDIICVVRRNASESIDPGDNREYESCGGGDPVTGGAVASALDLQRHHVAIMWMGADAFGKTRLMRVVLSQSDRQPHSLDLPGVSAAGDRQLSEVFLSRSPLGRITSLYTSTREEDPLIAQLPAFVQSLAGPLFTAVGTLAGRIPGAIVEAVQEPKRPKLWVVVKRVGLPLRRASIRLQAVAREPVSSAAFAADASRLASSLAFGEVPHAPCARGLASTLAGALPAVTQAPICSSLDAQPLECLAAFDTVITDSFDAAVKECDAGKPSRDALAALEKVDEAFRELVQDGTSSTAELDVTFKNRPPTHFSFGAGAGVMLTASLTRSRVDTKSGVLVADPLNRVMTMALVNWSPGGYDEKDPSIAPSERFRAFFGVALTPDFGPAFGVNVLLVRGIGLTAGGALLFGKGADSAEIGLKPSRPDDPYDLAVARAAFVGISYNYK